MKVLFLFLLLDLIVVALFCFLWSKVRRQKMQRLKEQAEGRLLYIRSLLDVVYTYQHNPEQLLTRLRGEMSLNKMVGFRVIEDKCDTFFDSTLKVNKKDQFLYVLHEEGFTPRELCVILGLNNLNSIYVKYHRVKKKLLPVFLYQENEASEPIPH